MNDTPIQIIQCHEKWEIGTSRTQDTGNYSAGI